MLVEANHPKLFLAKFSSYNMAGCTMFCLFRPVVAVWTIFKLRVSLRMTEERGVALLRASTRSWRGRTQEMIVIMTRPNDHHWNGKTDVQCDHSMYMNVRFIHLCILFRITCTCRRSSSGDRLSITPENLSPSPGSSPGLQVAPRGSPYSGSNLEVASASDTGVNQRTNSSSPTSYNSSTLPLRRHRSKVSAEEKNRKV